MRDSGFVIRVAGLGVAAGLALQSAQAGERKPATGEAHHLGAAVHSLRPEVGGRKPEVGGRRTEVGVGNMGHGEFSFIPVTPLKSEVGSPATAGKLRSEVRSANRGPSTPPQERKSVTFFRLDPKLGDVSVQPVVGGVNGAQLSVGF
jgi:hypothetical protein